MGQAINAGHDMQCNAVDSRPMCATQAQSDQELTYQMQVT